MINIKQYLCEQQDSLKLQRATLVVDLRKRRALEESNSATVGSVQQVNYSDLDKQHALLVSMVDGITNLSKEILSSIRTLKQKKKNINDLLNQLTSMLQTKALSKSLATQDGSGSVDALKKFVLELHFSLENVPARFFSAELEQWSAFKKRIEPILRNRLEASLSSKKLGEVNSITTIMNTLQFKVDVTRQYEELLSSNLKAKLADIMISVDKKVKSFQSIRHCLGNETLKVTHDIEEKHAYPEIFFNALVDALTLVYEALAGLHESGFVTTTPDTFKRYLSILFDDNLSVFLKQIRSKMDAFFGFDYTTYIAKKDEIAIVIEKDESASPRRFAKASDEAVIMEYYLTEVMNITSQFKMFSEEAAKEIESLLPVADKSGNFPLTQWKAHDIKRLLQSFAFNTEIMEMMATFGAIQERIFKTKLSIILSQSKALRVLFHGDTKAINTFMSGLQGDDKSESSSSRDTGSSHDYLDEVFYCLKNSLFRAVKSLDKIAACTAISFASSVIIGSDLYRLTKQLVARYLALTENESGQRVGMVKGEETLNRGAAAALNSIMMVPELTERLTEQIEECAKTQFESSTEKAELKLIIETCRSMNGQTSKLYRDFFKVALSQLVEGMLRGGISAAIQTYNSYDFVTTEKVLDELEALPTKWSVAIKIGKRFEGTLEVWRDSLIPEAYTDFVRDIGQIVANQMLGIVKRKKFNQLGGLLLDKEVRQLIQVLQIESGQTLAKPFAKLSEACEVLMVDSREEGRMVGTRVLESKEIEELLALRQDLL